MITEVNQGSGEHRATATEMLEQFNSFMTGLHQIVTGLEALPPTEAIATDGRLNAYFDAPEGMAFHLSRRDGQVDLAKADPLIGWQPSLSVHEIEDESGYMFDKDHPMVVEGVTAHLGSSHWLEVIFHGTQADGAQARLYLYTLEALEDYSLSAVSLV